MQHYVCMPSASCIPSLRPHVCVYICMYVRRDMHVHVCVLSENKNLHTCGLLLVLYGRGSIRFLIVGVGAVAVCGERASWKHPGHDMS